MEKPLGDFDAWYVDPTTIFPIGDSVIQGYDSYERQLLAGESFPTRNVEPRM